jgi:uncharacterized protein
MTNIGLVCLVVVFALTSSISVVTGGTSLITVPVMMQLGIEPRVSVATNMLSLIFLSLGGTVPFLKDQTIIWKRLPALIGLTLAGSILGALLLLVVPAKVMPAVVGLAMIVVAVFSLVNGDAGVSRVAGKPSRVSEIVGYGLTFILGVYGGFFSGGYVALLTAAFVACFGLTYLEAIATTKALNLFSSLVATVVFAARGLIDWNLGLILGAVSFVGAGIGAALARNMSNRLLRRFFLVAVLALAAKTLLYDVRW